VHVHWTAPELPVSEVGSLGRQVTDPGGVMTGPEMKGSMQAGEALKRFGGGGRGMAQHDESGDSPVMTAPACPARPTVKVAVKKNVAFTGRLVVPVRSSDRRTSVSGLMGVSPPETEPVVPFCMPEAHVQQTQSAQGQSRSNCVCAL
jgi:hypothetical protein